MSFPRLLSDPNSAANLTIFPSGQQMQPTVRIVRPDISGNVRSRDCNKTQQYFSQKETNHFQHQLQTTITVSRNTRTFSSWFSVESGEYNRAWSLLCRCWQTSPVNHRDSCQGHLRGFYSRISYFPRMNNEIVAGDGKE